MLVSNSSTVVYPFPPAVGSNASPFKFPVVSIYRAARNPLPLQVRSKEEKLTVQETVKTVTRRGIMHFAAAYFSATAFFSAEPSEARVRKPEVRKKIMEKLELERKKAGVSKNNLVKEPTPQSKENTG